MPYIVYKLLQQLLFFSAPNYCCKKQQSKSSPGQSKTRRSIISGVKCAMSLTQLTFPKCAFVV